MSENKEIAIQEDKPLTVQEIKAQAALIQEVMKAVMKIEVHYGKPFGTSEKLTLLKPGAEKLASTFRISIDPIVEDLSTNDEIRYRVKCQGVSSSGIFLGAGIGECSSSEEKYKWRASLCDEEFDDTLEDRKRIKHKKGKNRTFYTIKQIRANKEDIANTILKMAKKRAQVDMILTVTAASDIFDQDLEDLKANGIDPENGNNKSKKEDIATPQAKKTESKPLEQKVGCISEAQRKRLWAICNANKKTEEQLKTYLVDNYKIEKTEDIKWQDYKAIVEWVETKSTEEEIEL